MDVVDELKVAILAIDSFIFDQGSSYQIHMLLRFPFVRFPLLIQFLGVLLDQGSFVLIITCALNESLLGNSTCHLSLWLTAWGLAPGVIAGSDLNQPHLIFCMFVCSGNPVRWSSAAGVVKLEWSSLIALILWQPPLQQPTLKY
jgi:hypothetical protein